MMIASESYPPGQDIWGYLVTAKNPSEKGLAHPGTSLFIQTNRLRQQTPYQPGRINLAGDVCIFINL